MQSPCFLRSILAISGLIMSLVFSGLSHGYDYHELSIPIDRLENLAQTPHVLSLAQQQDGQLNLDQIYQNQVAWENSPKNRSASLDNKLQQLFKKLLSKPDTPFTELVLMGTQGETLAAYPIKQDYWQGDKDKFINVMASANIYIDTENWDEESQTISAQISVPVVDDSGELFGVLTGAVKASLEALGNLNLDLDI